MGKCKRCGKSGFFLRLKDGLCKDCYLLEQQKKKIIDSIKVTIHAPTAQEFEQQRERELNHIKVLKEEAIPSRNGLKPHEILMLSYAPRYYVGGSQFPRFWHYEFDMDDPAKLLSELEEKGFIQAASAKDSLEGLKVEDLKAILKENGLPVSGRKAALIESIKANISDEILEGKVEKRHYKITPLGEEELKENEYVTYFGPYQKYGISVWDMNKMLENYPKKLFRDRIWGTLNGRYVDLCERSNNTSDLSEFYRNVSAIRYDMGDILIEEKRNPVEAIELIADGLYYDILFDQVYRYESALHTYRMGYTKYKPSYETQYLITQAKKIMKASSDGELSGEDTKAAIRNSFERLKPSIQFALIKDKNIVDLGFSYDDVTDFIFLLAFENTEELKKVCGMIETKIQSEMTSFFKDE